MIRIISTIAIFISMMFFMACDNEQTYVPKPRIYPKVVYPEKTYVNFNSESCPFKMDIPGYFEVIKDRDKTDFKENNECWFDLYCEALNSYIHLSYLPIDSRKTFDKLVGDAFELADKHNVKASYRDEYAVNTKNENVNGIIFEIDGPVATPFQFFLTDSTEHFIRGSLYFKASVNRDSIQPVYDFLKYDVRQLIHTLEWKN